MIRQHHETGYVSSSCRPFCANMRGIYKLKNTFKSSAEQINPLANIEREHSAPI